MATLTSQLFYAAVILVMGCQLTLAARQPWELTKLVCEAVDKNIFTVKKCNLSRNPEGLMAMSAQLSPLKGLDNMMMKLKMMRKSGKEYRPFFVEATLDICDFFHDYKHQIPWGLLFAGFSKYTNMNHSCPYNHDLIIENFDLNAAIIQMVPMPKGDYLAEALVVSGRSTKLKYQIFVRRNF